MRQTVGALALSLLVIPFLSTAATGAILSDAKYAWGENMGWINFAPSGGGLTVTDSSVTGYAWSSTAGWINFNPTSSGQGVTNTTEGHLGGSAWVSGLGWLDMSGVVINGEGKFTGVAGTGNAVGRVSFDCDNCDVRTDWRPASSDPDDEDDSAPEPSSPRLDGGIPSLIGQQNRNSHVIEAQEPTRDSVLESLGISNVPTSDNSEVRSYDAPLRIPAGKSGVLVRTMGVVSASVHAPANAFKGDLVIDVSPWPTRASGSVDGMYVVGGIFFDITAHDSNGNEVHQFEKPITIKISVPEPLEGDIGLYWWDADAGAWVQINDAAFGQSTVTFTVDHLTRFAILKHVSPIAVPIRHNWYALFGLLLTLLVAAWLRRRKRRS